MTEKIHIVCPGCSARLSFNAIKGYADMLVECPKCHFKAKAGVYAQARNGNRSFGEGADTQLVMDSTQVNAAGQLRNKHTGEVFLLREGSQTIGRRARTSTADICIADDIYMSRRHVQIDVVPTPAGMQHRLVEINSKNILNLNGKPIQRGDVLLLKFGDRLTLGKSEIIFEESEEESTRIL